MVEPELALTGEEEEEKWLHRRQKLIPATASPETPNAPEPEIEGTARDLVRRIGR